MITAPRSTRLDDVARALANGTSRRTALKTLAAGAGAVLVALVGGGEVQAGGCRSNGTACTRNRQCCSRTCVNGVCACREVNRNCRNNPQCCSGMCEGGICTCRANGQGCSSGAQCCSGNCTLGTCSPL